MAISTKKKIIIISGLMIFGTYSVILGNVKAETKGLIKNKNISVQNQNINIKYKATMTTIKGEDLMVYKDSQNNEYAIKNNRVVGYLQNKKITEPKEKVRSMEIPKEYSKKAAEYASELFDINMSNYTLDKINYVDSYREITYNYSKYINGILTNDGVYVALNEDGTLSAFSASRVGLFDNLVTDVTKEKVEKYVDEQIKKTYEDIKYELDSMYIDYIDNKYIVRCLIGLKFNDFLGSTEILYYL